MDEQYYKGKFSGAEIDAGLAAAFTAAQVYHDTVSGWNAKRELIAERGAVYVYTDASQSEGKDIPAIKIGDGTSYLIDMPFVSAGGLTPEERALLNRKVSVEISSTDAEKIIFSTS